MKYDYFVAGRWRNHQAIREIVEKIRAAGKSVYCFIDNEYDAHGVKFGGDAANADADRMMQESEALKDWRTNPTFKEVFDTDMQAQRASEQFILVLPAGLAAHMEFGAAYGMGKKCYGIGELEKTETLYFMFEEIYPDVEAFLDAQVRQPA
jgi:hypothetical protein